jgi:hypothetical protein
MATIHQSMVLWGVARANTSVGVVLDRSYYYFNNNLVLVESGLLLRRLWCHFDGAAACSSSNIALHLVPPFSCMDQTM